MERAEIYRNAAMRIENDESEFSCLAVRDVINPLVASEHIPESVAYDNTFRPAKTENYAWGTDWSMKEKRRKKIRILALCFAAAMAETGDI